MELHEKIQELRKQKGLTQEELARILHVSRTAVSKWESGRGYPNIDSLKAIAVCFSVTVDTLLSSEELLTLAQEDTKQKETHFRDLIFGLLDISIAMFFFLPFFGQKENGLVQAVSLLELSAISLYLKIAYHSVVIGIVGTGILTLALQNWKKTFWIQKKNMISVLLNAAGTLLFIVSLQPYAAAFLFIFLAIKVLILVKKQ
jgi:transcriptional regulator with XRE-family HTH domain